MYCLEISSYSLHSPQVVGFRHPFLIYNNLSFQAVTAANYLYDSTLADMWESPTKPNQYFPYTMDFGSPVGSKIYFV